MSTSDVIETVGSVELVPVPVPAPTTLFRSEEPNEIVAHAAITAHALAAVITKQKLSVSIQGRKYVKVEGWTLLGTLLGVYPVCTWTRRLENGWEARVEARTRDGAVVGAAEAMCLRSERSWANRDDYALRSMAQTRATSKALRQPLGFVVEMAGFAATPYEELPPDEAPEVPPAPDTRAAQVEQAASPIIGGADAVAPPSTSEPMASPAQAKMVFRLISKLDKEGVVARERLLEALGKEYGTESPAELTKQQATDLITRLKAKAGET
jgi:hypothetical protein